MYDKYKKNTQRMGKRKPARIIFKNEIYELRNNKRCLFCCLSCFYNQHDIIPYNLVE